MTFLNTKVVKRSFQTNQRSDSSPFLKNVPLVAAPYVRLLRSDSGLPTHCHAVGSPKITGELFYEPDERKSMHRAIVLGGGMVGGTIARDLAADPRIRVAVADKDPRVLEKLSGERIEPMRCDLSDPQKVKTLAEECDLIVGAVPSFLGFRTLKAVLEAGKNYCDI